MTDSRPDEYLDPYREAQGDMGHEFGVTLWANTKSQERRFKVFTQMCYLPGKSILDAGCSRGDFAAYLEKRDIEYGKYVGIDGLAEVIDYANQRGLARAQFHAGDFVADPSLLSIGDPQVITFSGTLNTMDDRTAMTLLDAAWEACSQTLLFNFLSIRSTTDRREELGPAHRLDPLKYLDWAMTRTPAVQLRQDYFKRGHDATIKMCKI
jgi:SAM-dependent methyltransferase